MSDMVLGVAKSFFLPALLLFVALSGSSGHALAETKTYSFNGIAVWIASSPASMGSKCVYVIPDKQCVTNVTWQLCWADGNWCSDPGSWFTADTHQPALLWAAMDATCPNAQATATVQCAKSEPPPAAPEPPAPTSTASKPVDPCPNNPAINAWKQIDYCDPTDNGGKICYVTDADNDCVERVKDNCVVVANPDQKDSDGDGKGDACDGDDADGDGIPDQKDNCPNDPNPDQQDTDSFGKGDVCDSDADHDALSKEDEIKNGTDPLKADSDSDGIVDGVEVRILGSNPLKADTDGDNLQDGAELIHHTNPTKADTDDDGLNDGDEVAKYKTSPLRKDTDGDGMTDGQAVAAGLDPTKKPVPLLITILADFLTAEQPMTTTPSTVVPSVTKPTNLKVTKPAWLKLKPSMK